MRSTQTTRNNLKLAARNSAKRSFSVVRPCLLLLLCLAIASCSSLSHKGESPSAINPATHWQVTGKIALSSKLSRENPKYFKAQTLNFQRLNQGDNYLLTLNGSFGIGTTKIQRTPNTVTLTRGDQVVHDRTAEALFARLTGIDFPVTKMLNWLAGNNQSTQQKPTTTHQGIALNPSLTTSEFKDDGWQITYMKTIEASGFTLPSKISAMHDDYRVRAVMKDWQLGVASPQAN